MVRRYGIGKWRLIQKDEAYGPQLVSRSNVDLKVRQAITERTGHLAVQQLAPEKPPPLYPLSTRKCQFWVHLYRSHGHDHISGVPREHPSLLRLMAFRYANMTAGSKLIMYQYHFCC